MLKKRISKTEIVTCCSIWIRLFRSVFPRQVKWTSDLPGNGKATPMTYQSEKTGKQYLIVTVPNPGWRYPRDPKTGTYADSQSVPDDKGGFVIAYALGGG